MNTRKVILTIAIASMLAFAGCAAESNASEQSADDLAKDTGQDLSNVAVGGSYAYEIRMTEKNQLGLVRGQPPFIMDRSLERANLIRRYKYLNDANNVHHVYLVGENGKVVSYFVAQGKVSSVNSKLTNDKQIVKSKECIQDAYREDESGCFHTVESPQMDGSYGSNGDAIFFFTPSGHYVEWNGVYLVSEEPRNIQTKPVLVEMTNSSTGDN